MTEVRRHDWGSPDYLAFCELRQQHLRAPLGLNLYDEDLTGERDHVHFGLHEGSRLAGGAILIDHGDGSGQLRQMLVVPELRQRGLGRVIVEAVEREACQRGLRILFMNARVPAVGFYRRCGYETVGETFVSHGIPHYRMEKSL